MVDYHTNDMIERLHYLLLRLAGRVPDELTSQIRSWLAHGQLAEVAQSVAFHLLTHQTPFASADIDVLAEVLTMAGEETSVLDEVVRSDVNPETVDSTYAMAPINPEALAEQGDLIPHCFDLTDEHPDFAAPDNVDLAATTMMSELKETMRVIGLWRAWRYPVSPSPWPQPKRIFLVEVGEEIPGEQLPQVTEKIQRILIASGEKDPQVEVIPEGKDLPTYHRLARSYCALLWSPTPPIPITMARVFDWVDPVTGPEFNDDHPIIADDQELGQVLTYLLKGKPIMVTSSLGQDIVDPNHPPLVPLSLRTDGRWIWTDTVAYYLEHHRLAPDAALLAHIQKCNFVMPRVDSVAVHRALIAFTRPQEQETAWAVK